MREVSTKYETVWVVEGVATSTRRDMKLCRFSKRVMRDGAGQLLSYSTVFLNHDYSAPIGRVVGVEGLEDRILVKVEISKTQPVLWGMIREGVVRSFSIGAIIIEETLEYDGDIMETITVIERAQIMEVSIVFIPANPDARITAWYTELR
jgi:HK97 family phage prohead protease